MANNKQQSINGHIVGEIPSGEHGEGAPLEYFVGRLGKLFFSTDQSAYIAGLFYTDDGVIKVSGDFPAGLRNDECIIGGNWFVHKTYGEQFEIKSIELNLVKSTDHIYRFLSSGAVKGLGEYRARLLVDAFGDDTLEVIEKTPEKLLSIPGIGEKSLEKIVESYRAKLSLNKALIFFTSIGVSVRSAESIIDAIGEDVISVVKSNPYLLIDRVRGIGFKRADDIALKLGVQPDSPFRIRACISSILNDDLNNGGHTFSIKDDVISRCTGYGVNPELAEDELFNLVAEGVILTKPDGRVSLTQVDRCEQRVADKLVNLVQSSRPLPRDPNFLDRFMKSRGLSFDSIQREAIESIYEHGVYVITGGPGTGKTTVVNAIINAMEQARKKVALCAPTGRAAKKLSEATKRSASTIHRLLSWKGTDFEKNDETPLDVDLVVVDEISMVDIFLMESLLNALSPGTSLIMVGDKNQLPSVGPGSVLRDILASRKIKSVTLEKIYRQEDGSAISENAARIIRGIRPSRGRGFYMFGADSENLTERVIKLVKEELPERFNLDPVDDIQVLSVMRKHASGSGVINLNIKLREALNSGNLDNGMKTLSGKEKFCLGDKVMQIVNNYTIEWKDGPIKGLGIYNGDIGRVIEVTEDYIVIQFDDGRVANYTEDMLSELRLAYAITVHKSQGSEYRCVVMPLFPAFVMENRNILYTAVTRAKNIVVLVGDVDETLSRYVRKISIDKRRSTLCEKLGWTFG